MLSQSTFNFKDKKLLAIIKFLFYNENTKRFSRLENYRCIASNGDVFY